MDWKSRRVRSAIEIAAITVLVLLSMWLFSGCAGLPVKNVAGVEEIPYYLPGTDMQVFTASPAGMPETSPTWLDIGLKIVAAATGTSGALSLLSKNGRKALDVIADPQASGLASLQALGHVATFGYVPPPKET